MGDKIKIFQINNLNQKIREIKMTKPKSFDILFDKLDKKFENFKDNFIIFTLLNNNEEIIIENDEQYKLSKDILYIRKKNEIDYSDKSMFEINYDKLSESNKIILDEKYSCFICTMKIKNENPYFCYKCQKLYHNKCLNEWQKERNLSGKRLKH